MAVGVIVDGEITGASAKRDALLRRFFLRRVMFPVEVYYASGIYTTTHHCHRYYQRLIYAPG